MADMPLLSVQPNLSARNQNAYSEDDLNTLTHPLLSVKEPSVASETKTLAQALAAGETMLSVVIPLLNEEENLPALYTRLKAALNQFAPRHEILFVDDGSRDGSYAGLVSFWNQDPTVTVLRFRRNFGKAAALSAGFERVRGDIVLMMDADLQDQPEELPKLVAKMDEGYDLVTGWKQRRHDPLNKTLPSKLFNGTVSRYYKLKIHYFNCGLKIMRAAVAKEIRLYGEFHRFIPVLAANKGYRVTECVIEHAPRLHGVSKYGAKRLVTGMYDFCSSILLTKFLQKPMHLFGTLGLIALLLGMLTGSYTLLQTILGQAANARALWIMTAIFLIGGVQTFCMGLIAEMLTHATYHSTPRYQMAEVLNPEA